MLGVIREAVHTLKRVAGGRSSKGRSTKEEINPSEDAVWGLHVVRENPRQPPSSVYTEAHLVGWTAPGGQVRVLTVNARESAPEDHHHLSVACGHQVVKRSKRWQRTEFRENRVTHRQEYLVPSDPTVSTTDGGGSQRDDGSEGGRPFFRLYNGRQLEGNQKIMWREAAAPLPALLNAVHFAHVPATRCSESDASARNAVEAQDGVLVFSGGYSGLLRCSALPRLPNTMDAYRRQMGRPSKISMPSPAGSPAAELVGEAAVRPSAGTGTAPRRGKGAVASEAGVKKSIPVSGEEVRPTAVTPAPSRKGREEPGEEGLGGKKPRGREGSVVSELPVGSPDEVLGKEKERKANASPAATGKKPTEKKDLEGEKAPGPGSDRGADVPEAVGDSRDGTAARRGGNLGIGGSVGGLPSADSRRTLEQVSKGEAAAGASGAGAGAGASAEEEQKVLSLSAWAVVPKEKEICGRRRSSSI